MIENLAEFYERIGRSDLAAEDTSRTSRISPCRIARAA